MPEASMGNSSRVLVTPNPDALPHPIRMLRLAQVIERTGLGKTKIYELQNIQQFPLRVKVTDSSVRWIESEVEAWLAGRARGRMAQKRHRDAFPQRLDE